MAKKKTAKAAPGKRTGSVAGQPDTEPDPVIGTGGEVHQSARDGHVLTSALGAPLSDQNSLRAGHRGPTVLEDFALREKIFHFDHERIPERVVHARGYGAHGTFETTVNLSDVTTAAIFGTTGMKPRRSFAFPRSRAPRARSTSRVMCGASR